MFLPWGFEGEGEGTGGEGRGVCLHFELKVSRIR